MNDLITRWDWICLGIVVGILTLKTAEWIGMAINAKFIQQDLKMNLELAKALKKMQDEIEGIRQLRNNKP